MINIRERVLEQPGLSNIPGIAQFVNLLEDEFQSLYEEIESLKRNTIVNTVELLHPERLNRKLPVVGLAALEAEQLKKLTLKNIFKAKMGENSFGFSPVSEGKIYPLLVKYVAVNDVVWEQNNGLTLKQKVKTPQGSLLLGIAWNTNMGASNKLNQYKDDLHGFQLYFNEIDEKYIPFLPLSEVVFRNEKYILEPASFNGEDYVRTHSSDKEFLNLYYQRKKSYAHFPKLFRLTKKHDLPVEQLQSLKEIEKLQAEWMHLKLPEVIPDSACRNLVIIPNVFPLWNVLLSRVVRDCEEGKEIIVPIALSENESFLAIERIWSQPQKPFVAKGIFPNRRGSYELRLRDPQRLDSLDFENIITNLLQGLNDLDLEGLAALSINNNDDLQEFRQTFKEMADKWKPLKSKLSAIDNRQYYLKLLPALESKIIHIDYLSTQPKASEILWRKETSLETDVATSARLITAPQKPGKEKSFEEQLHDLREKFHSLLNGVDYE